MWAAWPALSLVRLFRTPALSGTLPSVLGTLRSMGEFDCDSTAISGTVPRDVIAQWTAAKIFRISRTAISGELPELPLVVSNMTDYYFAFSSVSGTVPPRLSLFTNLQQLQLQSTRVSGTLPDGLCALTNLRRLTASSTLLSGTLPPCVGWSRVLGLTLHRTFLSGTLPGFVVNLTRLQSLSVRATKMSGTVPPLTNGPNCTAPA
jgi:hypothetical protein